MFWITFYVVIGFVIAYWHSKEGYFRFMDLVIIWAFWPAAALFWSSIWLFDKIGFKIGK